MRLEMDSQVTPQHNPKCPVDDQTSLERLNWGGPHAGMVVTEKVQVTCQSETGAGGKGEFAYWVVRFHDPFPWLGSQNARLIPASLGSRLEIPFLWNLLAQVKRLTNTDIWRPPIKWPDLNHSAIRSTCHKTKPCSLSLSLSHTHTHTNTHTHTRTHARTISIWSSGHHF